MFATGCQKPQRLEFRIEPNRPPVHNQHVKTLVQLGLTKRVLLISLLVEKRISKIALILDVENSLLKSDFGTF